MEHSFQVYITVSSEAAKAFEAVSGLVMPSVIQSGRTVRVPANTGHFGRLRSHLRSSYRVHTGCRVRRNQAYAISNERPLKLIPTTAGTC